MADSRPGKDHDTIRSFISGIDDIDLRPIDARPAAGDQAFTFSGGTARAWSVWCVDTGPDILVRADVTGDGRADFEILVANVDRLTASDFLLPRAGGGGTLRRRPPVPPAPALRRLKWRIGALYPVRSPPDRPVGPAAGAERKLPSFDEAWRWIAAQQCGKRRQEKADYGT
ncbi:hypothetical protein LV780_19985 (plasmid) [Cereibacter azotoformans]|uniref:hypothetical protein n=1 Tax=Cereibacter azotoformans TaxID=43057 RepID=UPI000E35B6FE|nr:hypothetical protein [Cereibacter azotoformans]AXQ96039.1 hypothetical protein D0Z66_20050 [Cereibacter sphaeroides]UIJ33110.1 hypothetical protein LV780_19985 [Cereibacter azotoformans]